ncbi:MAG: DNA repair protein RecO [Legionellales bacterium]|nr:DNA repair protein RecO [Legionellales bacterium]HAV94036.1 DNA repair protein RecO [Pseudomonadota bacterium]
MQQKLNKQPFIDAFLIHKKPYLESKVIVYLLTEAHGLIAAMTHWSQSKKNHLSTFSTLSCQLLVKPNFSQLKKIEIKTFQAPLQGTHLFAGLYINELIYRFCETNQSQPELYACYIESIQQLSQQQPIEKTIRRFEFHLQELLGYGLNYECLIDNTNDWFYFDPEQGLKPSLSTQKRHIHRSHLENLRNNNFDDPGTLSSSKKIFALLTGHILGKNQIFTKNILPKTETQTEHSER